MLTKKLGRFGRAIAFAAVGLTATGAYAQTTEEMPKVVIAHSTKSFAFLTFFVASAMDYFEEAGVDVEEVRTGSGSKAMAAMVNGDANIYIGSTTTAFKTREKGVPVKIIAPVVRQLTSSIVVSEEWAESHGVTKDSTIPEKLKALEGARIAMSGPGSGSDQVVRYVAAEAGFDPERDMQIVPMGSNAATYMSAMQAGQIDGFSASPPHIQIAEKDFNATILLNLAAGELPTLDGYFYIGMISRDDWIEENTEAGARVLRALQMAMDAVHDPELTKAAAQATFEKYYPDMDRDLFQSVWDSQVSSVPVNLEMSDAMLRDVLAFHNQFSESQISADLIPETLATSLTDAAMSAN
ncbi:ABC transporter substrate-binding protein [Celeribacter litoreus]|uniref:ABC transporter substrate-binding protein n=1 Tax=Celeribacter litoreus TaxID=2876714 RepID=UPI001CCC7E06|nr:ABC transporter substrate-binding protein [Celeribacter litoreus]MCA0042003.1 ABC transporter substrate-binding protein [Celeribacter litoreus]